MISSKLTAGFVALILVAATQMENSAAVAAEPVGYQYEHTLKWYNSCLTASTNLHFEILSLSEAKAKLSASMGLGGKSAPSTLPLYHHLFVKCGRVQDERR